MGTDLTRIDSTTVPAELVEPLEKAREFVKESVPENTRRAYATDWALFSEWCYQRKAKNLPADAATIAAFIADESSRSKPSTIRRRLAAIRKMHQVAGHPNPCEAAAVKSTIKGVERQYGIAQEGKAPATLAKIEAMVNGCAPNTLDGLRARAILLVGFAGAFRRSELCAMTCEDLKWSSEGVIITVRRSKTDQRGKGMYKAIPYVSGGLCAATALKVWLNAAGIDSGPVFRSFNRIGKPKPTAMSDHALAIVIKTSAGRCGLDPNLFSGHSLRAGHVTEARSRGVSDAQTMATTGHKRVETLDGYDRRENAFQKTSAGAVLKPR